MQTTYIPFLVLTVRRLINVGKATVCNVMLVTGYVAGPTLNWSSYARLMLDQRFRLRPNINPT